MNIEADIKWIEKELREVKDPVFIEFIKTIFQNRKNEIHSEGISIEEYNREIEEALKDIEEGRVHSHEEVRNLIEQWGKQ